MGLFIKDMDDMDDNYVLCILFCMFCQFVCHVVSLMFKGPNVCIFDARLSPSNAEVAHDYEMGKPLGFSFTRLCALAPWRSWNQKLR